MGDPRMSPESLTPLAIEFWIDAGVALLCGALFGVDRVLRGKPIGLIVCILVVYGTNLFIVIGGVLAPDNNGAARVLGQVVTGVGFLGAGVMIAQEGRVRGVNTAATIWALAAVGALVGAGFYQAAISTTLLMLLVIYMSESISPKLEGMREKALSVDDSNEP
jgi:putative Mg2+ transporter-C (MgtC) family protein